MKNKLDTFVNFPISDLDLSQYVMHKSASMRSHVYELYAVINHYGGLGGGHYTAYAKVMWHWSMLSVSASESFLNRSSVICSH